MAAVHTLWAFQAQPATRELRQRQAHHADLNEADSSEDEIDGTSPLRDEGMVFNGLRASMTSGGLPHDMLALAEQAEDRRWLQSTNVVARAGSTQETAEVATRQRTLQEARRAARGQHLPWRGQAAEDARLLRVLDGVPPLGSTDDADQLSDWEETFEIAKQERIRFGERDIVQIGRRRTLHEEELSRADDDIQQRPSAMGITDVSPLPDLMPPPPPLLGPTPWDSMSADMDPNSVSWSDTSRSYSRLSIPTRHGNRPRTSLPHRWTPQRIPATNAAIAAVAALDHVAQQSHYMGVDLDGDMDDMDTST